MERRGRDRQGAAARPEATRNRSRGQGDRSAVERDHGSATAAGAHAMRPLMPAGSTMLSIRPIGSSPDELERRWNEALQSVEKIEGEIAATIARRSPPLGEPERQQLMALGADLERAWSHPAHPAATAATRKRI